MSDRAGSPPVPMMSPVRGRSMRGAWRIDAGARNRIGAARWLFAFVVAALAATVRLGASEVIPPAPENHFNDYAGVVRPGTAQRLNAELAQFERDTSNQIVVAIYPHMQSDSSLEDYTVRVYEAWHVGQKGRSNGAVLFVFTQDHRLRIATGYGLEGALPDALCKRIISDEIAPRLRAGDFDAGMTAGVQAMMAAARGEYRGTGRTAREARGHPPAAFPLGGLIFFVIIVMIVGRSIFASRRNVLYGRTGPRGIWINPGGWGGGGWGGGGGGGGWSGGGGGGSFSGGGGSTGGGGASGSW